MVLGVSNMHSCLFFLLTVISVAGKSSKATSGRSYQADGVFFSGTIPPGWWQANILYILIASIENYKINKIRWSFFNNGVGHQWQYGKNTGSDGMPVRQGKKGRTAGWLFCF